MLALPIGLRSGQTGACGETAPREKAGAGFLIRKRLQSTPAPGFTSDVANARREDRSDRP
jgi:hypothetical protein